jgi:AP2-associated kinase
LDFLREKELAKSSKMAVQVSTQGPQRPVVGKPATGLEGRKQKEENLLLDIPDSPLTERREQTQVNPGSTVTTAPTPKRLAGKFGDAFSRFEEASSQEPISVIQSEPLQKSDPQPETNVLPERGPGTGRGANALIDIDEDNMTPEMRRELERQKLEEEEKRVAAAQAEYRNRVGPSGKLVPGQNNVGAPPRTASTIQSRVQSLLSEDQKQSNIQRTAHGYGKYTDDQPEGPPTAKPLPSIVRKPVASKPKTAVPYNGTGSTIATSYSTSAPSQAKFTGTKPPAPKKKPTHLTGARPPSPIKHSQSVQSERLMAADLPGQPVLEMSARDKEDYIEDFAKRFPSLSSIEMESQGSRNSALRR